MKSSNYRKLELKTGDFIGLLATKGIYGKRIKYTEYMSKISIHQNGKFKGYFKFYYKPTTKSYNYSLDELLDSEFGLELLKYWEIIQKWNDRYVILIKTGKSSSSIFHTNG